MTKRRREMKASHYFVLSLLLGLAAAIARMVYFFFPIFNVLDVIVFGSIATALAYHRPHRWWLWVSASIAPVIALLSLILSQSTIDGLRQGIGTGHLLSAVLIPVAAVVAGALAARIASRRSGRSSR